ncbi:glucosamine-6-phosphate deaminase [Pokkaliibacter plantistimulans]|uniref:Glucosamine-6-phosphate deaminase n=1 Tax=Proteobacteria bacterium 228 TaxID=2083153 RepID=A0A2S5KHU7_9PROT|nr:glucosamine-6-phosphate deaminase [Pokkaliibacter plantistimulans]PPC74350.1 glucosamine-6-phosphate deaminase [Pokkaliibacter plantistimulans]
MRVVIAPTDQIASKAADIVCQQLQRKPDSVLGLATGSTPVALYRELISRYQQQQVSFARVASFNLDEYIGLSSEHPQSYRYFMQQQLFDHIDIAPERTHVPDGMSEPLSSCQAYEQAIGAAGGIDLQILGIGHNGHIGFNEPGSSLSSHTRIKTLTPTTLEANRRFFRDDEFQPCLAITMGIATILQSRQVLLLASGEAKAEAVQRTVEGSLSAFTPASSLQMHEHAIVLIDEAAASQLQLRDYYLWCEQQRSQLGM